MPTFILMKKTAFKDLEAGPGWKNSSNANVRRPYMGFQASRDRFGCITVFTKEGKKLDLLDLHSIEKSGRTTRYTNFIIQQFQRTNVEKAQVIETWGEDWLLTYGERPKIWAVSGTLVSSIDFPWEAEFWYNYEHLFRSTKLAEMGARIFLEIDNQFMSGYMMQAQAVKEEQVRNRIQFSFQIYVTHSGFYDTMQEEGLQINLKPTSTQRLVLAAPSGQVDYAEYAQINEEGAMLLRPDKKDAFYDVRSKSLHKVVDEHFDDYDEYPHNASRMFGAIPGDSVPPSFGRQIGRGFGEAAAAAGKSELDRKMKGNFMGGFPLDMFGKRARDSALAIHESILSKYSEQDMRAAIGDLRGQMEESRGISDAERKVFEDLGGLDAAKGDTGGISEEERKVIETLGGEGVNPGDVKKVLNEQCSQYDIPLKKIVTESQGAKTYQEDLKKEGTKTIPKEPRPGVYYGRLKKSDGPAFRKLMENRGWTIIEEP